jgi:pimeloyl-ACP methyl ester carboxylesterase
MTVSYTRMGEGPPLLLLHATLSSSQQLRALAARLARRCTVISVDRRGSGRSTFDGPAEPIDVADHVADLAEVAQTEGFERLAVVGHSYGGCLALELAARQPVRVTGLYAYEPPYAPLAPPAVRAGMAEIGRRTLAARDRGDLAAAALTFMEGVSGPEAVAALSPAARARIGSAGQGAVADATLLGMDPDGLARISCPVRIATGGASERLYVVIADGLVERIPGAEQVRLEGLDHMAPVLQPEAVAASIEEFLGR